MDTPILQGEVEVAGGQKPTSGVTAGLSSRAGARLHLLLLPASREDPLLVGALPRQRFDFPFGRLRAPSVLSFNQWTRLSLLAVW